MSMIEPIVDKSSGLKLFFMTVFGRSYPRIVGLLREKSWLFFDIFVPLLSVSAYVFVYRAIGAPEDYVGFVVVGGAMTAFWMNILWSMSSQLYWEKEQGNLALYIISPASMMAILLGMALGGLFATLLRAITIILFGSLIFNVTYYVASFWQLFAIFSLSMISLYGLGMMSASIFLLLSREAWHISNLATEPVYLISGMYFPVKNLGFWGSAIGSIIPLTLGLDAIRQLVFKTGPSLGFLSVKIEIIILIALSFIYIIAAKFLLAHIEKLAMREGRLTENRR
ncbi:MAG: ABC transporter permease [Anaerolineaceae bacterium]|jgi:ABC-2 type transport system permease protein|nr:ABC transporter permease [Anaerolineaceae bacterium]